MSGSIVWTEEEAQYLRALLAWRPSKAEGEVHPTPEAEAPVGQFRFLIIGGGGCGKTSILSRVNNPTPMSSLHAYVVMMG